MIALLMLTLSSAFATPDMAVTGAKSQAGTQPRGIWATFTTTVVNKGDPIPSTGITNVTFTYAGTVYSQSYTGAIATCDSVDITSQPIFIAEANLNGTGQARVVPLTGETNTSNNGPFGWIVAFPPLPASSSLRK